MHLIFLDGFCFFFFNIPFGSMVKFESFAPIPVDHRSHPIIHGLVFLCKLAELVCVSQSKLYLQITNTCYSVVYYPFLLQYNWFLWLYSVLLLKDLVFLLRFSFLSPDYVILCAILVVYWLKYSCFSSHFCFLTFFFFVYPYLDIAITGYCN